jgi:hypothetical protein
VGTRRRKSAFLTQAFASMTRAKTVFFYTCDNYWTFFAENQSEAAHQELGALVHAELCKLVPRRTADGIIVDDAANLLLKQLRQRLYLQRRSSLKPPADVTAMFLRATRTLAFCDVHVQLELRDGVFLLRRLKYPALDTLLFVTDSLGVTYKACVATDSTPLEDILKKLLTQRGFDVFMDWLCAAFCGVKQAEVLALCSPLRNSGKSIIAFKLWRKVLGLWRVPRTTADYFTSKFISMTDDADKKVQFARDCGRASLLLLDEAGPGALQDIAAVKALQGTGGVLGFKHSREILNTEHCYSVGFTSNEHPGTVFGCSAGFADAQNTLCIEVQHDVAATAELLRFYKDNSPQAKRVILATLLKFIKRRMRGEITTEYIDARKVECKLAAFTTDYPVSVWDAKRRSAAGAAGGESETGADVGEQVAPASEAQRDAIAKLVALFNAQPPRIKAAPGKTIKRRDLWTAAGVQGSQATAGRLGERLAAATDALMLQGFKAAVGTTKVPAYKDVELVQSR